jgi:hypothetical protein
MHTVGQQRARNRCGPVIQRRAQRRIALHQQDSLSIELVASAIFLEGAQCTPVRLNDIALR